MVHTKPILKHRLRDTKSMLRVKLIGCCQGIFRIARFSGFLLLLSIIPICSLWSVAHYTSEPTLRLARDELPQRDRQEWMDLAAGKLPSNMSPLEVFHGEAISRLHNCF
ncbi:hypothetical protein E4U51_005906 [Claviceps purpurea]|nr:hypothetical protein E4U51_005906 [Claviceps purpurea]